MVKVLPKPPWFFCATFWLLRFADVSASCYSYRTVKMLRGKVTSKLLATRNQSETLSQFLPLKREKAYLMDSFVSFSAGSVGPVAFRLAAG